MKQLTFIIPILIIVLFSSCKHQSPAAKAQKQLDKASRKFNELVTDYPQLVVTDTVVVERIDTFVVEKEALRPLTINELDSFLVIIDTIKSKPRTPENIKKEVEIKGRLVNRCTLEELLGWKTYTEAFDSCNVRVDVSGNKLKVSANVHQFTTTISDKFIPEQTSYLGHLKEVWHVPAVLFLITGLLILERRPRA